MGIGILCHCGMCARAVSVGARRFSGVEGSIHVSRAFRKLGLTPFPLEKGCGCAGCAKAAALCGRERGRGSARVMS